MLRQVLRSSLLLVLVAACSDSKIRDKGEVDESLPPESPIATAGGKADDPSRVIPIEVESTHPYDNDLNEEFVIDLEGVVPVCASRVRLHFATLQLEEGYDFLHIVDAFGNIIETGTGNHDDEYSEWLDVGESSWVVSVVLETDFSITRHGFRIDGVEWEGAPICPAFVPTCPAGQVDINPPPAACECPALPTCVDTDSLEASHSKGGGFTGDTGGTRLHGTTAIRFTKRLGSPSQETILGTIDQDALEAFFLETARTGVLHGQSVSQSSNMTETLWLSAGPAEVTYALPVGSHPPAETAAMDHFDTLFECGAGRPLTCAAGLACVENECVEETDCPCLDSDAPVCGVNGETYDNACLAECAGAVLAHEGECGITGDECGGVRGLACQPDHKCRYDEGEFSAPFPNASGQCVAGDYCDAPVDCVGLIHISVPGSWACNANQCSWETGSPWTPIAGWSMESTHPYENDASVWQQLYAPDGTRRVRLEINGAFSLENGYDFLDVWTWNGSAWVRVARLTGQQSQDIELDGRYHYVHFVSDYSVTDHGFSVTASYQF